MVEPTEPEILAFAQDLLLVEEAEVLTILGWKIGVEGNQPVVSLRFSGRVNNSQRHAEHNVAMSPRDALQFVQTVADSVLAAFPRDAFGQRQ